MYRTKVLDGTNYSSASDLVKRYKRLEVEFEHDNTGEGSNRRGTRGGRGSN